MMNRYSLLAFLCFASCTSASSPADIPAAVNPAPVSTSAGSSGSDDYEALCEKVKCSVLESANQGVRSS